MQLTFFPLNSAFINTDKLFWYFASSSKPTFSLRLSRKTNFSRTATCYSTADHIGICSIFIPSSTLFFANNAVQQQYRSLVVAILKSRLQTSNVINLRRPQYCPLNINAVIQILLEVEWFISIIQESNKIFCFIISGLILNSLTL